MTARVIVGFVVLASMSGCVGAPGYDADLDHFADGSRWFGEQVARYDDQLASRKIVYKPRVVEITPSLLRHDMHNSAEKLRKASSQVDNDDAIKSYRLGIGDVLKIIVYGHPELTMPGEAGVQNVVGSAAGTGSPSKTRASSSTRILSWLIARSDDGNSSSMPTPTTAESQSLRYHGGFVRGQSVSGNGTIYVPYVGEVQAQGRTVSEVRSSITQKLAKVIPRPAVDLRILRYRSKHVFVSVPGAPPCAVPVTDMRMTALDALDKCNTLALLARRNAKLQSYQRKNDDKRPRASSNKKNQPRKVGIDSVKLFRNGKMRSVMLNEMYSEGKTLVLKPGDRLRVSGRNDQVVMAGEFQFQRTVPYSSGGMSLGDAIASAGGLRKASADTKKIFVFRDFVVDQSVNFTEHKKNAVVVRPKVYEVDLSSPQGFLLATRFRLNRGDIVFAPTAPFAPFNRAIADLAPKLSSLLDDLLVITYDN